MQAKYDAGVTAAENCHAGCFGGAYDHAEPEQDACSPVHLSFLTLTHPRPDAKRPERRTHAEHGYGRHSGAGLKAPALP